jgi:hypothetical protein
MTIQLARLTRRGFFGVAAAAVVSVIAHPQETSKRYRGPDSAARHPTTTTTVPPTTVPPTTVAPSTTTTVPATTTTTTGGGGANLLTGDSSTFEGGTLGVWGEAGPSTVTNSTAVAHRGTHSMKIVTGAVSLSGARTSSIAATPGRTYAFSVWIYAAASGGQVTPEVKFVDTTGNALTPTGTATTLRTTTWTELTTSSRAPAGTVAVILSLLPTATTSPATFYADDASLSVTRTSASSAFTIGVAMGADLTLFDAADYGRSQFEAMVAAGFTTVRMEAEYNQSFAIYENGLPYQAALDAGLDMILILDGYDISIGPAAFISFCQAMVGYFSPLGVHKYEILNEENYSGNWDSGGGTVNPGEYAALIKAVYPAIKVIDSRATVAVGGLAVFAPTDGAPLGSGNYAGDVLPGTFMTQMYAALGGHSTGAFDAVCVHPYTYPANPVNNPATNNWGYCLGTTGTTPRTAMIANGDAAKPIWITEYGAPSGTAAGDIGTAAQATMLSDAFELAQSESFVGAFYVFNWADDQDGDFGLLTSNYVPKPALASVRSFM